jgi:CspA family cold shock protein
VVTEASAELGAMEPVAAAPAIDVGQRAEQAPRMHEHEDLQEDGRCRGTVKWFSDAKGYGFIRGDDGRDVFVHYSAISNAGFRTLTEGQAVEYEVQQSAKGLHAVSVTPPGSVALRSG